MQNTMHVGEKKTTKRTKKREKTKITQKQAIRDDPNALAATTDEKQQQRLPSTPPEDGQIDEPGRSRMTTKQRKK